MCIPSVDSDFEISEIYYTDADTSHMVDEGWYVPEVYAGKTFQGLSCNVMETQPTFCNYPDQEERSNRNSYLCVTVAVTDKVREATKALDDDFSGTSIFSIPSLPDSRDRDARCLRSFISACYVGPVGLENLRWPGWSGGVQIAAFTTGLFFLQVMRSWRGSNGGGVLAGECLQAAVVYMSGGETHRAELLFFSSLRFKTERMTHLAARSILKR